MCQKKREEFRWIELTFFLKRKKRSQLEPGEKIMTAHLALKNCFFLLEPLGNSLFPTTRQSTRSKPRYPSDISRRPKSPGNEIDRPTIHYPYLALFLMHSQAARRLECVFWHEFQCDVLSNGTESFSALSIIHVSLTG